MATTRWCSDIHGAGRRHYVGDVFRSSGCLRFREKGEVKSATSIVVVAAPKTATGAMAAGTPWKLSVRDGGRGGCQVPV
ncbi:hypothetical protein DEO72_LG3g1859 [Vigna unguiculata]|uniref:Uncharacterized protein n=1 Tax=Vigna unguiculata TaxID=3917 RepID=A0A4D6LG79_VIGUN|nr:hypothetical protein DEO72_LG3g1859 [Vigna unguiculata]